MTSADATVWAAVISVSGVFASVTLSFFTAKATAKGKLNELRQNQIGDVLAQRIAHYPSLWELCQRSIAYTTYERYAADVADGWASTLSNELEAWHAKHGVFLSQNSYEALSVIRRKCRTYAVTSNTAKAATAASDKEPSGPLNELEKIWRAGFDHKGKKHDPLAACLKNDLGSYAQAALSQS
jgi:hypothetical protein